MIRLLLVIILIIQGITFGYLSKNKEKLSHLLNPEKETTLTQLFQTFGRLNIICMLIGCFFIWINRKDTSLMYIALVLIMSSVFSLKLSKNIHSDK